MAVGVAGATAVALLVPAGQAGATGMNHEIELHAGLHHSAAYPHASGSAE